MPTAYFWNEKCVSWKSFIIGFMIWFFMIAVLFLFDTAVHYTAESNDLEASPYIYAGYDVVLDGEDLILAH
jgi:hypothetical protein